MHTYESLLVAVHAVPFLLSVLLACDLYFVKKIASRANKGRPAFLAHSVVGSGLSIVAGSLCGCFFHFAGNGDDGRLVVVLPAFGLFATFLVFLIASLTYFVARRFGRSKDQPVRSQPAFIPYAINAALFGLFYVLCRVE